MPLRRRLRIPNLNPLATALALLLASVAAEAAGTAPAAPAHASLDALPSSLDGASRIEAALLFRDLRSYRATWTRSQATLRETRAGREWLDATAASGGLDAFAELSRLVDLAAPGGGPVPAAITIYSLSGNLAFQAQILGEPGLRDRLLAPAPADAASPAWTAGMRGDALEIRAGGTTLAARIDDRGWLRIAPEAVMLHGGAPVRPFGQTMARWALDSDILLFVQGGGMLAAAAAANMEPGMGAEVIGNLSSAAVTWKSDGDKTMAVRLLLDSPMLGQLGSAFRKPDLANSLTRIWGREALGFVSLTLPTQMLAPFVPLLQKGLAESAAPMPDAVASGLTRLEGRVGAAWFGSPSDWAIGLQMSDPKTAAAMVPAMQQWVRALASKELPGLADAFVQDKVEGVPDPTFLLRPDPAVEGPRVTNLGSTLAVVRDKSRLVKLHQAAAGAEPSDITTGPLTPLMQETLRRPALLLGYAVLGYDGSWAEIHAWVAKAAEAWLASAPPGEGPLAELPDWAAGMTKRLPAGFIAGLHANLLSYDIAVALDLDDGVVVGQILGSEL